jgi:hypothetical protein
VQGAKLHLPLTVIAIGKCPQLMKLRRRYVHKLGNITCSMLLMTTCTLLTVNCVKTQSLGISFFSVAIVFKYFCSCSNVHTYKVGNTEINICLKTCTVHHLFKYTYCVFFHLTVTRILLLHILCRTENTVTASTVIT